MHNSFDNFSITLINTKKKQYELLSGWIVILQEATLVYLALSLPLNKKISLLLLGLFLPLLDLSIRYWRAKKSKTLSLSLTPFYTFSCIAWLYGGFYKAGALVVVLYFLYRLSLRTLIVKFSEQGIDYPSFPRKQIAWKTIEQAIVKDNLLTIDLRSNRLMQHPIEKNSFIDDREVAAFNAYCQHNINYT